MIRPEFIIEELRKNFPGADLDMVWRAYAFAAQCHRGQKRSSGEPYLNHPLAVAHNLAQMKLGHVSVSVGLLHDTIEDTLATPEQIRDMFGEEVWAIVDGVTKISRIEASTYEERQAENIRKMILAMAKDIRVILVKLADRIHNMRTLNFLKPAKQRQIAQETLDIYAPLANRLGINWIKSELENSAFMYLWPVEYGEIKRKVARLEETREDYIDDIVKTVNDRLAPTIPGIDVKGRPKHFYSIFAKMRRQKITFEEVFDIMGVRVVTPEDGDCYTALGQLHSLFKPVPGKLKDYIALPKANGYQSLHTTIVGPGGKPVELQIRSRRMHVFCEEGIAAHWRYKEGGGEADDRHYEQIAWLRRLLEWQQEVQDPKEFLEKVKIDLFPDEVYVFTPRQEVKSFPRGATPIDFAFAVHTDVGHHCVGAKINGKLASLKQPLKNGDIVEILTNQQAHPSRDWLKVVATSKARTKISNFLRQKERSQALGLGRQMLEKEIVRHGFDPTPYLEEKKLTAAARLVGHNTVESLLIGIGLGKVKASMIAAKFLPKESLEEQDRKVESMVGRTTKSTSSSGVRVSGVDDVLVRFAHCCNPTPGEPIIGFISRGRGLVIHSADCSNAMNLGHDSERRLDVEWDMETVGKAPATLLIESEDRPGILAGVSAVISDQGANITEAATRNVPGSGKGSITLTMEVADIRQLNHIIHVISQRPGVLSVERVRDRNALRSRFRPPKRRGDRR
jgi:GTP pyrophosphokinase